MFPIMFWDELVDTVKKLIPPAILLTIVVIAIYYLFGLMVLVQNPRLEKVQREAVELGYATWVPDKNGWTTFTWKVDIKDIPDKRDSPDNPDKSDSPDTTGNNP